MSPKRLGRVAPPSVNDEWHVRFGTTEAAKGWDDLCAHATVKTREAFELMRSNLGRLVICRITSSAERERRAWDNRGTSTVLAALVRAWQLALEPVAEVRGSGLR